ncbi:J domain-containing protein [Noviherbaspirillum saxi]|uniref:Molecular chaperone DnaJ n=1 Tax=Noviherbaspirillum saxi TaxID=2320863 RepID=A0A3A3FP30_9BURK|nr:J domain-containing protein [Noviherbaspirillum saxi]RJF97643.1 molecular chaperone DnaJ [Noviherbaspirillum saxi]
MLKPQLAPVQIAGSDNSLSKAQKTFNSQILQIEKLRTRLAAWDTASTAYQEKYTRELVPLLDATTKLQIKLIYALDHAAEQKGLTRAERNMLQKLIVGLAEEVLAERDDPELTAIHDKYSGPDDVGDEATEAAALQVMKGMLEDMFGVDLGDDTRLDSPEEIVQRMQAQFEEQQAGYEAKRQAEEERRAKRKKTAKQLEKEAQAEEDARKINQSIREIYRKLASALHPDRETDPEERLRKTALMQRINQAYDKQNLLQLLELQLELEHIDRNVISRLDEERLRHYNAILKKQVAELKQELMRVESAFCAQFHLSPFVSIKPETVMRDLDCDIASIKLGNREIEQDLQALESAKGIKAWLKKLRRRPVADDFYDLPF